MSKRGLLVVVSGFSGAGKGTVLGALKEKHPGQFGVSISCTTRAPRTKDGITEKDGEAYFFKTVEEFQQMIADDALLEYACYDPNYYGTPRKFVEDQLNAGKDVILEIEQQGAFQVKAKIPETVLIFMTPPSVDELYSRLTGRGTETPEAIAKRMSNAVKEAEVMSRYEYIVVNDEIDACAERLNAILEAERQKVAYREQLIADLSRDLQSYK